MADFIENSSGLYAEQRPGAVLDYSLDWSDLLVGGDTFAPTNGSVWACEDPAITITNQATSGAIASAWLSGGVVNTWYRITNTVTTAAGRRDVRSAMLFIKDDVSATSPLSTAIFPSKFTAIAKMRRDRLMLLANSILPDLAISDDYLWEKLVAAESTVAHRLRVPLQPTHFFPSQPTQEQLDAIGSMPWEIDVPYDYSPDAYMGDKWGMILMRNKPVQSITSMKFQYPSPNTVIVDVPHDWIRYDGRFGQVQLVPTGTNYPTMLGGLFMSHLSGGKQLPFTVAIEYVAGIANVNREYPELVDAVMKLAAVKIVEDAFMPQSGSISADGLSQSLSVDAGKYHEAVDNIIDGPSNSNGGLMTKIHGIRLGVI